MGQINSYGGVSIDVDQGNPGMLNWHRPNHHLEPGQRFSKRHFNQLSPKEPPAVASLWVFSGLDVEKPLCDLIDTIQQYQGETVQLDLY